MFSLSNPFVPNRGCICDPVISHNHPFSTFFGEWVGVCLWTPLDLIGYVVGIFNLFVTATIQGPQLVLNFRRKDCSGVSRNMLLLWVTGDFCGFLGLLLTSQYHSTAFFQQTLGLVIDFTLLVQWFIYNRNKKEDEDDDGGDDHGEDKSYHATTPSTTKRTAPFDDLNEPLLPTNDISGGNQINNDEDGGPDSDLKVIKTTPTKKSKSGTGNREKKKGLGMAHPHNIAVYIAVLIALAGGISPTSGKLSQHSSLFPLSSSSSSSVQHPYSLVDILKPPTPFYQSSPQPVTTIWGLGINESDPTPPPPCETPIPDPTKTQQTIGYAFAVICGLIYTPSLSFQVVHNYRSKDATGMSIYSICTNIFAYILYFIAVLIPNKLRDWHQFKTRFWLGLFPYVSSFFISCCCLCIILFQKWLYLAEEREEEEGSGDSEVGDLSISVDNTNRIN